MDFTREPIIETVITPKEGCKLVVRSSKSVGQEEYFVDAVEVVTFGNAIFFRSTERPKPFIVPAFDYEVLEVREARIVLKNAGLERSIKIAGGREGYVKPPKEPLEEKEEAAPVQAESGEKFEARNKRERRRPSRRRRGRDEIVAVPESAPQEAYKLEFEEKIDIPLPQHPTTEVSEIVASSGSLLASLLEPPPLISETIARYKEKFKDAFYTKEEQESKMSLSEPEASPGIIPHVPLEEPALGSFEISEESEEEIYRERRRHFAEMEEEDATPIESSEENSVPEKRED